MMNLYFCTVSAAFAIVCIWGHTPGPAAGDSVGSSQDFAAGPSMQPQQPQWVYVDHDQPSQGRPGGPSGAPGRPGHPSWTHPGFHPSGRFTPVPQQSQWFQRPYPYHLDYYRMKFGGGYDPYFGNLYGPPVILAPPFGFQAFPGAGLRPGFPVW